MIESSQWYHFQDYPLQGLLPASEQQQKLLTESIAKNKRGGHSPSFVLWGSLHATY